MPYSWEWFMRWAARALDQGLGWDTAVVQTVAAEFVPLHEGYLSAQRRSPGCRDQPGGPATDDDQIVP